MNLGKFLEKSFKRVWVRLLSGFINFSPTTSIDLRDARRILLLRFDRVGDMVISTGLFRILNEQFPGLAVEVLASPDNARIAAFDPAVSRVHVYDKRRPLRLVRLLPELRKGRYDAVVNLVFYPSLTGALMALLAAPRRAYRVRVATGGDDKNAFYHVNIPKRVWGAATRTMLEETVSILEYLGVDLAGKDVSPRITVPHQLTEQARALVGSPVCGEMRIGINLSAGHPSREWSPARWEDLVRMGGSRMSTARFFFFSVADSAVARALRPALPADRTVWLPPTPDILLVAACLARMDLLVTPDTAFVHMASGLSIPTVAMYTTREKEVLWTPYGVPCRTIVSPDGVMDSIDPAWVARAIEALADEIRLTPLPGHARENQ